MNFDNDVRALLAKHDGLSDTQVTLGYLMARVEQIRAAQIRYWAEGKTLEQRQAEGDRMEREYLHLLDVSLGIVRNPTAGTFPTETDEGE